jgi:hypothetical protein
MGDPPSWRLGVRLTTPHRKKISLLGNITRSLGPGQSHWINDLSERNEMQTFKKFSERILNIMNI